MLACQVQDGILLTVRAVADNVVIAVALLEGNGIIALAVLIVISCLIAVAGALINPRDRVKDIIVPACVMVCRPYALYRPEAGRLVASGLVRNSRRPLRG